jgi:hypothetical protein
VQIADASQNEVKLTSSVATLDFVESQEAFPASNAPGRITQQAMLPTAVQTRFLTPLQDQTVFSAGPVEVPSGASLISTIVSTNNDQQTIRQFVDRQVFVGGDTQAANRMPQFVSSSLYPQYESDSLYDAEDHYIGDKPWKTSHVLQIRNNSDDTQTFIIWYRVTLITNRAPSAGTSGIS